MSSTSIFIKGMYGLGDNIYQRPFVKALTQVGKVYVKTAWPEVYCDLGVELVRPQTKLRTQALNVLKHGHWLNDAPAGCRTLEISYVGHLIKGLSIPDGMEKVFGIKPASVDLPVVGPSPVEGKYVVVKPVTVRKEWLNSARNPDPQYLYQSSDFFRSLGYKIVSVAHLKEGEEWLEGPPPQADLTFHEGQLSTSQLISLVSKAKLCLGGVGFIVPMCIALKTPLIVILGGQGAHNSPKIITNGTFTDDRIGWITPDNYCFCSNMKHACNKSIRNLNEQLLSASAKLGV